MKVKISRLDCQTADNWTADMSASEEEEECPVCKGKISNPSQPSSCCGKVFCQRCLNQSFRFRTHCPHCRFGSSVSPNNQVPSRRHLHQILPGNFDAFNSRAREGSNIHALISRLQDQQAQHRNTGAQVILPNQATLAPAPQNQAHPLLSPATRPVPMPRIRFRPANVATLNAAQGGVLQAAQRPAPAPLLPNPLPLLPNPVPVHTNPIPLVPSSAGPREDLQAMLDDWSWQTEITLMENNQPQSLTLRTFVCPYCQDNGMDELDLRNHCNDRHANDSRRVVCPVCVATPHGDPQYYSRNFVGHLNLRHCYYMDDITNLHQSDEMNLQCAILASYMKNI